MSDPPRHDTPATVREAQELGISIKMLTGDAVAVRPLPSLLSLRPRPSPRRRRTALVSSFSVELTRALSQIAKETCRQLSMGDRVYDSERLLGGGMSGSEMRDFLEAADGFAEVFPEHKCVEAALLPLL